MYCLYEEYVYWIYCLYEEYMYLIYCLYEEYMYWIYCRSGNFRCKNIFVACANHENKKHEIILQQNSQDIFVCTVSQHS